MRNWLKVVLVSIGIFLVVLGLIFLLASFNPFDPAILVEAVVLLLLGAVPIAVVIIAGAREKRTPVVNRTSIEIKADDLVGGDRSYEKLKCESCGGSLSSRDVRFTDLGLVVNCPYCSQVYVMEEKAKW